MKWNLQKCIIRLHWYAEVTKGVFGLHFDCDNLGRKFNPTKCDFYPAHHILEDQFEALVLDAVRYVHTVNSKILFYIAIQDYM